MKIEKLACCLAHPVTALRAIKEKVNEIIDGLELVEAGGGGGGNLVVVTVDVTTADVQTFTVTGVDKKYSTLETVYNAGGVVYCRVNMTFEMEGAIPAILETFMMGKDENGFAFVPTSMQSMGVFVQIRPDDTAVMEIE